MTGSEPSLHEVQALIKQLNVIAERINVRNEQSTKHIETSTAALGQGVHQLTDSGEHLLDTLRAQGAQALSEGAGQAFEGLCLQMQQSIDRARQLEQVLMQHSRGVIGLIRTALIVLVVGALMTAGASVYVAHDRLRAIEGAEFNQNILQATNSGAINQCGDKLCVRVGKNPSRYKSNPNYMLVE
jgi:hypothetical protein